MEINRNLIVKFGYLMLAIIYHLFFVHIFNDGLFDHASGGEAGFSSLRHLLEFVLDTCRFNCVIFQLMPSYTFSMTACLAIQVMKMWGSPL